jgi:hypothetical protein
MWLRNYRHAPPQGFQCRRASEVTRAEITITKWPNYIKPAMSWNSFKITHCSITENTRMRLMKRLSFAKGEYGISEGHVCISDLSSLSKFFRTGSPIFYTLNQPWNSAMRQIQTVELRNNPQTRSHTLCSLFSSYNICFFSRSASNSISKCSGIVSPLRNWRNSIPASQLGGKTSGKLSTRPITLHNYPCGETFQGLEKS